MKLRHNGVAQCDHATLGQIPHKDAFRREFHERVHAGDGVYMGNEAAAAAAHCWESKSEFCALMNSPPLSSEFTSHWRIVQQLFRSIGK